MSDGVKTGVAKLTEKCTSLMSKLTASIQKRFNDSYEKLKTFFADPQAAITTALSKLDEKTRSNLSELGKFGLRLIGIAIMPMLFPDATTSDSSAPRKAKSKAKSEKDNAWKAIWQGIIASIELDWLNEILEGFNSSLDKLAKKSFNAVKNISLLFITSINSIFAYFKNNIVISITSFGTAEFWEKAIKETDGGAPFINGYGLDKIFGIVFSFINLSSDIENAGNTSLSKNTDIILSIVSLAVGIASVFIPNVFISQLVSDIGVIIPDIVAKYINGIIY